MKNSELKHPHHTHKLLIKADHHRGISSLFGICKTGLVSCIEYDRNNQTLISKSELNMRQHDLETHGSITTQPGSDTTCREWRSGKGVWTRTDPCRVQPWVILIFQLNNPMEIIICVASSNYPLNSSSIIKHA